MVCQSLIIIDYWRKSLNNAVIDHRKCSIQYSKKKILVGKSCVVFLMVSKLKKKENLMTGKHRKNSKLQARTKLTTLRVLDQTFLSLSYWNSLASKVKSTEVPFLIHFMCLSGSKTWYNSCSEWNLYRYFSKYIIINDWLGGSIWLFLTINYEILANSKPYPFTYV